MDDAFPSAPQPANEGPLLVCFAVKEEAKFFKPPANTKVLITGMGRRNAFLKLEKYLAENPKPSGILTCGFAGGLNPCLEIGSIIYDVDEDAPWAKSLMATKAMMGRFQCAARVACTADEKYQLWRTSGDDAIEMESDTLRQMAQRNNIPSATIRSISDTAHQNLPLDFNRLLTPDHRIDFAKLAGRLLLQPSRIAALMRFQDQTIKAAQSLATFLHTLLASNPQSR